MHVYYLNYNLHYFFESWSSGVKYTKFDIFAKQDIGL